MLFAGHSGTGSCPVFGVGKAVLLPLIRSLKNRSWRTALHARRKENVFGKLIFSFQGSVSGFDKLLSSASTHHFARSIYISIISLAQFKFP